MTDEELLAIDNVWDLTQKLIDQANAIYFHPDTNAEVEGMAALVFSLACRIGVVTQEGVSELIHSIGQKE